MAHPFQSVRENKVERSRVAKLTKGYAAGGAVSSSSHPSTRPVVGDIDSEGSPEGGVAARRADRPGYKRGGRVKPKANNVTVVVNSAPAEPKMPMPPMMPPPPPGLPPGLPPGPMAGPAPGGLPPDGAMAGLGPMPPRSNGGRAYKRGGAVKPGPAWSEGLKEGTKVTHDKGKSDISPKNLDRGKPVTFASGGGVKDPKPIQIEPDSGGYNSNAVNRAIESSNRSGPKIGSGEAKLIHGLLKGRTGRATGGPVNANGKPGKQMGPKLPGGVGSGEGRLAQSARAKRK